jgi:hypothetical protein
VHEDDPDVKVKKEYDHQRIGEPDGKMGDDNSFDVFQPRISLVEVPDNDFVSFPEEQRQDG